MAKLSSSRHVLLRQPDNFFKVISSKENMTKQMDSFKVAAIQETPLFLDKERTVEKACKLIAQAGREGASFALFPEAFISGYPDWVWTVPAGNEAMLSELYSEMLKSAVSVPDWSTEKIAKAAKEAGIHVAIGVNEKNNEASNASIYNTLLYFNSDGKLLGKHRKLIPTGGERLVWTQGDGKGLVSFDTDLGRIGGLICWENFMPLARTVMYEAGVQIYLAPTWDSSETWQVAMRHIAREGGCYVISCAPAMKMSDIPDRYEFKKFYPDGREWIKHGNSCIVDPSGKIIAGPLKSQQEILYAEIDLTQIPAQKFFFDVAGHYARPDVFNFSVTGKPESFPKKVD